MCEDFESTFRFLSTLLSFTTTTTWSSSESDNDEVRMHRARIMKHVNPQEAEILSQPHGLCATLLPIQTVGVQGDGRSYSYVCGLSSSVHNDQDANDVSKVRWMSVFALSRLIPRLCHNINRVVYIFGERVSVPIRSITPTLLRRDVLHQLRLADDVVNQTLLKHNLVTKLSQVRRVLNVPSAACAC